MIPPTNPKKKSLMPSGELRRALRGHGHALSPLVQVGKAGVTDGVVKQVNQALADHELVKIKVGEASALDRHTAAGELALKTHSEVAQVLGNIVLLYRPDPDEPAIQLPKAAPGEPDEPEGNDQTSG